MIIPVFDIKDNIAVSGKSGKRDTYTRLKSIYGDDILQIAQNLKDAGSQLLYIADLDKIEDNGSNNEIISQINQIIPVMLDNGIRTLNDVEKNNKICTYNIVATETLHNTTKHKPSRNQKKQHTTNNKWNNTKNTKHNTHHGRRTNKPNHNTT